MPSWLSPVCEGYPGKRKWDEAMKNTLLAHFRKQKCPLRGYAIQSL